MLLLCDGGGSNASNRYVFKYHFDQLANHRLGLELRMAHYPPYCSKYNPIEHRLFPHVTQACQGLLLTSLEVAVATMQKTATKKGLRTTT